MGAAFFPRQRLCLRPEPQGQGALRPTSAAGGISFRKDSGESELVSKSVELGRVCLRTAREANEGRHFGVEPGGHGDLVAELVFELGARGLDGFVEGGVFEPAIEGGAVDLEFGGGLDGRQIGVEICRSRRGLRRGRSSHCATKMESTAGRSASGFL